MNPAKPSSPTADERRQKIAASNEVVNRKRRQTQDLIDRKNRLALQAKTDHQQALDEKSRVMGGAERQLMIQQRQHDYRNAAANAIVQKENEKEITRLERWDEIKQVGEELSEISVSWEDLPTLPDILFDDNPA
jgi:uncharacterized protein YoxC